MRTLLKFFLLAVVVFLPQILHAQYSQDVFQLRKAADLYDERGFSQGASISVDGKLAISNQNGSCSYVYPISSFTSGGYPVNVSLNYCTAVQFTAYKSYNLGHKATGTLYDGWSRFHQHRAAWILSVNSWAVNVINVASHFHGWPGSHLFQNEWEEYDDTDLVWLADGYDVSGRMRDIDAVASAGSGAEPYRDVIRILRGDGSVLELMNIHTRTEIDNADPDTVAKIYSGQYFSNEANSRAYGVVTFDSSQFIGPAWNHLASSVIEGRRYPLYPRILKYYAGDGTETVFRERIAPYGLSAYADTESKSGGLWGHPTVFYLESIRSNAGTIVDFKRARHTSAAEASPNYKTTRGRAPVVSFTGHEINLADGSMTIQALGRTSKIKFGVVSRSGTALSGEPMPLARLGGLTDYALEVADYPEHDHRLFKGFTGYITEIIDPENRVTKFNYEAYTKRYRNTGFPHAQGSTRLTLKNYRLKEIKEPTARYVLKYYGDRDVTIYPTETRPAVLNNLVDSVRKFSLDGTLLTTDVYTFDQNNLDNQTESFQYTTDHVTGHTKTTRFLYENYSLNNYEPILTPGRHTVLKETIETTGNINTGIVQTSTVTSFRTAYQMPEWGGYVNYTVLPVSQVATVNGIARSHQEIRYELDTLRDFWKTPELSAMYGMEVTRKITSTMKPDEPSKILLVDTTTYLHLPMPDSMLTTSRVQWNKFKSIANFLYLRDTIQHPAVVGRTWDEMMYRPPVAVFDHDSLREHSIPPIFGLEERSWTTDTTGAVTGKRNIYLTDVMQNGEPAQRGVLIADSILGSNNQRILKGAYTYRREWTGHLLASIRNALGVETSYSYGGDRCENVPYWEECTVSPPIWGTIVANDNTTRQHELTWSPFSYWFNKPTVEQSVVRRYNAAGLLRRDTLTTYTQRTHFGQANGTIDANGYYSRYDYDYNGRLDVAWLPLDFSGTNLETLPPFEGAEIVDLFGTTHHQRRSNQLHCWPDGNGDTVVGAVQETVNHDTLYARLPITTVRKCPCVPLSGAEEKEQSRELQSAPCIEEYFPYNDYVGQKGYFGHISHQLNSASPIKSATRIDSIFFETMITAVDGMCVHLEVSVDSIFSKTFVLNCSSEQDPDEDDDPPNSETKRQRRSLQSGLSSVAGGYKLVVDISSIASQLASRPAGSSMNIELRVKTPGSTVAFINGTNAEDLRPRLHVYGQYQKVWDRADYTLAYEHDDKNLTTTLHAKVDDAHHSTNDLASQGIGVRRSTLKNFFGADYRLLKTERTVIEPDSLGSISTRIDISRNAYTGLGAKTKTTDAVGDTLLTRYDHRNRPIEIINPDGTRSTIEYIHATPASLGITDQDFFGYCDVKVTTNEKGMKVAEFSDAFGRVRREVADYGYSGSHLNTIVRYEYNLLGRLVQVINPKGDTTRYTHDDFGRVRTKSHPDLGMIFYVYDNLGNVRFVQDEEQGRNNRILYNQYDDLNRPVLIGEAYIDETGNCGPYDEDNLNTSGCGDGKRLTDSLDGNHLHIYNHQNPNTPLPITANPTLFMAPYTDAPTFIPVEEFELRNCQLDPEPRLGETESPALPLVMHETRMYRTANGGITGVWRDEFEDVQAYPEFARIGIHYDRMPISSGAVWKQFPLLNIWDRLAPTGKIRNQKGHEAAVAYRDKSSEPFHYSVLSYDERGRVECLLRYNENLGFDGVYYQYNSANQVIAVTVADPLRRFTSWFGYDQQGRMDTVWTHLDGPGSGLMAGGDFSLLRFPGFQSRQGIAPEIVYSYTKVDQVKTMAYPAINTLIEYAYNHRKLLDSLVARRNGSAIFSQRLEYDPSGQIIEQNYKHGSGPAKAQEYEYDALQRLTTWNLDGKRTTYQYDLIGNRENVGRNTQPIETYQYQSGTNRLSTRTQPHKHGLGDTVHTYGYNGNGAQTSYMRSYIYGSDVTVLHEEHLGYNFRGLNNRARVRKGIGGWQDWRYRFGAHGEREQKRLYEDEGGIGPAPDSTVFPWCYYLLGGNKEQFAVYHGQQLDSLQTDCGDAGKNRVYVYPFEYITYGAGSSGLLITRPSGRREYKVVDHLGSTRAILDDNGSVIGTYDTEPFGESVAVTGVDTRKDFIDKENDEETETSNHGVRQYDRKGGRFTSVDPLWEKFPSQTPYQYCFNSPLTHTDRNGKIPIVIGYGVFWIVTAIIVTAAITHYLEEQRNPGGFLVDMPVSTAVDIPAPSFSGEGAFLPQMVTEEQAGMAFGWALVMMAADKEEDGPVEPVPPTSAPPVAIPPIPADPSDAPGAKWEWRGKNPAGNSEGAWYNPDTKETLHPDLNHPLPIGPHWDYIDPDKNRYRVYPDGRVEPNPK